MKSPTSRNNGEAHAEDGALESAEPADVGRASLLSLESELFQDVTVCLKAGLGEVTLTVRDVLDLRAGSVVKLEQKLNDYVELRLNDSLVAIGEIVAVGDHFGVRLIEVAPSP